MTLFLCYFYHVLWRFDTSHMVLSGYSAPNPIQSIRFSQIVPHFHSISTPYPFPYGFPLHCNEMRSKCLMVMHLMTPSTVHTSVWGLFDFVCSWLSCAWPPWPWPGLRATAARRTRRSSCTIMNSATTSPTTSSKSSYTDEWCLITKPSGNMSECGNKVFFLKETLSYG